MQSSDYVDDDNISIEIDPSVFDKPDSQLTQQLYEMARKIAESDRNNEIYRQAKKSKSFQLDVLKRNKSELEGELNELQKQISMKKVMENKHSFNKNNRVKCQEVDDKCQMLSGKQKNIHNSCLEISRQNQRLEKKLSGLQAQYESMLKQNKYKTNMLNKVLKQKDEKAKIVQQNQQKIQFLQRQCQETKNKAESLQSELKEELTNQQQLEELIRQRQSQLETQRHQREQTSRKKEENKKVISQMANTAKILENQIQAKFRQGKKLEAIHDALRQKMQRMEQQQRKLEEFMTNRRALLGNLRQISTKATNQQEELHSIRGKHMVKQ